MPNSEVITKEVQVDTINKITKDQKNMIDSCIDLLKEMKSKGKVDEASVRNLTSLIRELDSLR